MKRSIGELPLPRRLRFRPAVASAVAAAMMAAIASFGPAQAATESRKVADFDEVVFALAGEVRVEQGSAETLSIEAEPAVLRKITVEVRDRRLLIALAPGRIETQEPIRIRLGVRNLRAFQSRTAGTISIGALRSDALALELGGGGFIRLARLEDARSLTVRISGAGNIAVAGGKVVAQQVTITGSGNYLASELASEHAEVTIEGHGDVRLATRATLAVRIGGIGQVRYHGNPTVTRNILGVGSIDKD